MGDSQGFQPENEGLRAGKDRKHGSCDRESLRGLASVEYTRNYGQVDNDSEMVDKILAAGIPFFGEDGIKMLERPLLSGEDFSFFSSCVPSVFMLMGTGLEYGLHHPRYDVPESMLPFSAAWEAYMGLTL